MPFLIVHLTRDVSDTGDDEVEFKSHELHPANSENEEGEKNNEKNVKQ